MKFSVIVPFLFIPVFIFCLDLTGVAHYLLCFSHVALFNVLFFIKSIWIELVERFPLSCKHGYEWKTQSLFKIT